MQNKHLFFFTKASNKGRYTLEKKNKNIEIVNFMERQGKMKDNGVINMQYNHENEMDKLIKNISRVHLFQRHTDSSLEELYRIEEEYVVCIQTVNIRN